MLPTPPIRVWSSSARLTSVCRRRRAAEKRVDVEGRVERVDGDVRQPAAGSPRPALSSTARPPKVRWSTKRSSRPPSVNVNRARRCVSSGCGRLLDEQLAAHAEVGDERLAGRRAVGLGQRQPQVLAAAVRGGEGAAGQGGDEVVGPSRWRRTAAGGGPRRWRRCGRRPTAPGRAGRPRPRAAPARLSSRGRRPTGRARRPRRPPARRPSWSGPRRGRRRRRRGRPRR